MADHMEPAEHTAAEQAERITDREAEGAPLEAGAADSAPGHGDAPQVDPTIERAREAAQAMARQCLGSRARILSRSISRIFDDHFRAFDVTGAQLYLLGAIGFFGPKSPTELARALSMDKSTLSRNLQRLVERGLVAIDASGPGRGQSVDLTPAGGDLLLRIQPSWAAAQDEVRALLGTDDADLLLMLGNRLWQHEQEA